mmetsp:Transcript_44577/g.146183  ORF Transcript_44577/g.146183 Transcript_44577/m.146183 type:complete len:324 (+) Transcript_44577:695-1666(+)
MLSPARHTATSMASRRRRRTTSRVSRRCSRRRRPSRNASQKRFGAKALQLSIGPSSRSSFARRIFRRAMERTGTSAPVSQSYAASILMRNQMGLRTRQGRTTARSLSSGTTTRAFQMQVQHRCRAERRAARPSLGPITARETHRSRSSLSSTSATTLGPRSKIRPTLLRLAGSTSKFARTWSCPALKITTTSSSVGSRSTCRGRCSKKERRRSLLLRPMGRCSNACTTRTVRRCAGTLATRICACIATSPSSHRQPTESLSRTTKRRKSSCTACRTTIRTPGAPAGDLCPSQCFTLIGLSPGRRAIRRRKMRRLATSTAPIRT